MNENADIQNDIQSLVNKYNEKGRLSQLITRMLGASIILAFEAQTKVGNAKEIIEILMQHAENKEKGEKDESDL